MNKSVLMLGALALMALSTHAAPKRSRSDAVPGMQASNTAGLGDIWVQSALTGQFRVQPLPQERLTGLADSIYRSDVLALYGGGEKMGRDMLLIPSLKATLGLAEFLQFEVENVPWDGEKIGASRAGLKLTTPGNDDLRVFGLAIMAEATLSTEEDIYSRGETTPGFDPLFHFGAAVDIDLIKKTPTLPLKLFFNWNNLADYRLAHAFKQQLLATALQWKGYRREYFGRFGLTWYKPLATRFDPFPNSEWTGPHVEFGFGTRWFFGERLWGCAEVSFDPVQPLAFYSDPTHSPPKFFVGVELPVMFQETQAEALRALIYTEEMRKAARRKAALSPNTANKSVADSSVGKAHGVTDFKLDQFELKSHKVDTASAALRSLFEDQDSVAADKRKNVRRELQQIEEILK